MPENAFESMDRMMEERCTPDYVAIDVLMEWLTVIGETERWKDFMQQCGTQEDKLIRICLVDTKSIAQRREPWVLLQINQELQYQGVICDGKSRVG